MTKGIKTILIIAAVCIVLSVLIFTAAVFMGGGDLKNGIETEVFGVDIHMGADGIYAGYSVNMESTGVETKAEFTEKIDAFDINWTAGNVNFEFGGENITVVESASGEIDDNAVMFCTVENGTLKIHYREPKVNFVSLGEPTKNLTVTIPEKLASEIRDIKVDVTSADVTLGNFELKNLRIASTSGNVYMSNVSADSFVFDATSGDLTADNCSLVRFGVHTTSGCVMLNDVKADYVGFDMISGDVNAKNCTFGKVEAESTSGCFSMDLTAVPKEFDADTTSGSVELILPEDSEFELEFDPISGDLTLDFAAIMRGDEYIVGSGKNEISIETTSGDAFIKMK